MNPDGRRPRTGGTRRPLLTSLLLLLGGLVTLAVALMLLPRAMRPPQRPTPEVERVQAPAAAMERPLEARVYSGGDVVSSREPATAPPVENEITTTIGSVAEAPPASGSSAHAIGSASGTTIVSGGAPATSASNAAAIGGGPRPIDVAADGGANATGEAGVALGDGGFVPYPTPILAAPVYGAPPSSTSSAGPTTYGATGDAAPLWTGGTSGGGGGNPAVVDPRASIATSFLLTMSDADDPERAWTTLTPYLRPSDVVVAHVGGVGPNDVAYMDWGDRVHIDTPLVQYLVALDDASKIKDLVARGVPVNVGGVGLARTDGFDAVTLSTLSSAAHAAGKRFFVSASTSPPVALAQIGARADLIELVLSSSDPTAAVAEAANAAAQLRIGGAPTVFVRLPTGAASTSAASTFVTSLANAAPNVGVSIPYGVGTGFLGDLRASP